MTTKEYIESRRDLRRLLNVAWFMGAVFASGILDSKHLHNGNCIMLLACMIAELASAWILAPKCSKCHVRLRHIQARANFCPYCVSLHEPMGGSPERG
jgi:hypothetical protein